MQFSFQFPPAEDAPAQARAALEVFDQILVPEVLEDLQLVVSELVTNSVKFGPKRAITLALTIGSERRRQGRGDRPGRRRAGEGRDVRRADARRRLGPAPRRPGRGRAGASTKARPTCGSRSAPTAASGPSRPERERRDSPRFRSRLGARQVRRSRSATSSALRSAFSWALDELVLRLALALLLAPFACAGWRRRRGPPPPS